MNLNLAILRVAGSLKKMIIAMNDKNLELSRITKTAYILILSGISRNSIPDCIVSRCCDEQEADGGWVGIVDTMWNIGFLKQMDTDTYKYQITRGCEFLNSNVNRYGLWGRSRRDMSRIPVSGMLMTLLPETGTSERLRLLEELWFSERNSLTYKAAYTLMAFRKHNYTPQKNGLIYQTIDWLLKSQRVDGSFAPWKNHPVESDVFCTSVSAIGLLQYPVPAIKPILEKTLSWLLDHQLPQGIWPFHEIEDGASWGLWALSEINRFLGNCE